MGVLTEIPKRWRQEVCEILDHNQDRIFMTLRASQEWENLFPGSAIGGFSYQLYARMSEALKVDGIKGVKIPRMGNDTGEIWEFFFHADDKKLYGKISLRLVKKKNGRKEVFIYSAHLPDRDSL